MTTEIIATLIVIGIYLLAADITATLVLCFSDMKGTDPLEYILVGTVSLFWPLVFILAVVILPGIGIAKLVERGKYCYRVWRRKRSAEEAKR